MKVALLCILLPILPCIHAMNIQNRIEDPIARQYNPMNGDSINIKTVGYDLEKTNVKIVGHDAEIIIVEVKNIHFLSTAAHRKNALITIATKDLNTNQWTEKQESMELEFHNDSRSDKDRRNNLLRSLGIPLTVAQLKEIGEEYIQNNFDIHESGPVKKITPKNNCGGRYYY